MKMAPTAPTLLTERDAIIAAAMAASAAPENSADAADVREGFRVRGMGFSASIQNIGSGANNTAVTEAFDVTNVTVAQPILVNDAGGDNDGSPEPGENVTINVPVTNTTGATVNNVMISITGGGTVNYGNIANGATVSMPIPYSISAGAACGSKLTVNITGASALGALNPSTFSFFLGKAFGGTNTAPIAVNDFSTAVTYPSTINVSGLSGAVAVKLKLFGFSHSFPDDIDVLLVGPGGQKMLVMSDVGGGGDVVDLDLALSDAAATGLPDAGPLVSGDFKPANADTTSDAMPAPAPVGPYENPAPAGAATFASVFGTNGANMNGTWSLYIRDDAGQDIGAFASGWALLFGTPEFTCQFVPTSKAPFDFDGDHKTDVSIFRPADGSWWYQKSSDGSVPVAQFGTGTDVMVPGDFTGDGKADIAIWRPSNGNWFILRSEDGNFFSFPFGATGDIPMPADFDGDGKTDAAVFRPATGEWFILQSGGGGTVFTTFGGAGDQPVSADYDGDGRADIGIARTSGGFKQWWVQRSTAGLMVVNFGAPADKTVSGDYTGDGKADVAVFKPTTGEWLILRSEDFQFFSFGWGQAGDIPVPGDYDGDGRFEASVFRPSDTTWYINRTGGGGPAFIPFGSATDKPVPNAFAR
jgi:subtilisin-like proprotein convertase family protein